MWLHQMEADEQLFPWKGCICPGDKKRGLWLFGEGEDKNESFVLMSLVWVTGTQCYRSESWGVQRIFLETVNVLWWF